METANKSRESILAGLLAELTAAEETYDRLAMDNEYPEKTSFFRQLEDQRRFYAFRLAHEYHVISRERRQEFPKAENSIYAHLPPALTEGRMTASEVDAWVIGKEQDLAEAYQRVLAYPGLPNVTYALLGSQAEEINNMLLKLRADLRIQTRTPPVAVYIER